MGDVYGIGMPTCDSKMKGAGGKTGYLLPVVVISNFAVELGGFGHKMGTIDLQVPHMILQC